jgi:CheY-like chemotaxis protein/two-component sensor histidine kinase
LISDLLDISRIVSGKLRLQIDHLDLATAITDAVETVQKEADEKGIVIHRALETTLGTVAGDPARLQQIVWNLLSNAIKFTPAGGTIRVQLRRIGTDAGIIVTDSGVGIRPEVLPDIFDRFHQADQSITRRFGGLGLGLSIVKHLVELHGGSIAAHSDGPDQGATFTVVLPAGVAREKLVATPVEAREHDARLSASLSGLRVLVVEDEPDTREFLERFLKTCGADVIVASTVDEALAALPDSRADILVSDIGLPAKDGYDLVHQVRQLPAEAGGAIPAIALTAYARSEDRTRAFRAGFQAHLAKPVEPTELVATISSFAGLIDAQRRSR